MLCDGLAPTFGPWTLEVQNLYSLLASTCVVKGVGDGGTLGLRVEQSRESISKVFWEKKDYLAKYGLVATNF